MGSIQNSVVWRQPAFYVASPTGQNLALIYFWQRTRCGCLTESPTTIRPPRGDHRSKLGGRGCLWTEGAPTRPSDRMGGTDVSRYLDRDWTEVVG